MKWFRRGRHRNKGKHSLTVIDIKEQLMHEAVERVRYSLADVWAASDELWAAL